MNITLINVMGRLSSDGSRLISALLKREGHHVTSIFLARPEPLEYTPAELEPLADIVKETELVFVAVYSSYAIRALQVTEFIKKKFPDILVVWGGPHCISVPELCLRHADGVCFSEGDRAIIDFVQRVESGNNYVKTPNMAFRVDGSIKVNEILQPFEDLDGLPYYDYDLEEQFLLDQGLHQMTKGMLKERMAGYPYYIPIYHIVTSRGCPHSCSYCNNCRYIKMFKRNAIRFQSVDRVIKELLYVLEHLDFIKFIGISDDDFLMRSIEQIEEFAMKYKQHIGLPFGLAMSANSYREEKMEVLLDSGLRAIQMGVQSGSQRVLDEVYHRNVKVSKTVDVVEKMGAYKKSHGLDMLLDFIIDNPYETGDDIIQTYYYLLGLPDEVKINLFFLAFFPGTPIYDQALQDGIAEPFNEKAFRFYTRSQLKYQVNYETFLIIFIRYVKRNPRIRFYMPDFILRMLGMNTIRRIASFLPESLFSYFSRVTLQ